MNPFRVPGTREALSRDGDSGRDDQPYPQCAVVDRFETTSMDRYDQQEVVSVLPRKALTTASKGVSMNRFFFTAFLLLSVGFLAHDASAGNGPRGKPTFDDYAWTEINGWADWTGRAGLEAVVLDGDFYILGG